MGDPKITRLNERLKAVSNIFFNLSAALAATLAAKVYNDPSFDLSLIVRPLGVRPYICRVVDPGFDRVGGNMMIHLSPFVAENAPPLMALAICVPAILWVHYYKRQRRRRNRSQ